RLNIPRSTRPFSRFGCMAVRSQLRRRNFHRIARALCAISLLGCGEADQIHSYSAPKELKPVVSQASSGQKSGDGTDRMLAAILPIGKQAYFFKAVGPVAYVDRHEKDIRAFFIGLEVGPDDKPKWQLPADW